MPERERCAACWHASEHAWWGPSVPSGYTHCRDCHETFAGGDIHCVSCHNTFGSIRGIELHQRADGCHHPSTIVRKRDGAALFSLVQRSHGAAWCRVAAPVPA